MSRRGAALFAAMCVIWGLPYLMIRVAVRAISPFDVVCFRTGIAAIVLLPIAATQRVIRPTLARWRPLVVFTVVELAVPWVLLPTAEEKLPSSLSGLLVAAVPLVGAVIAPAFGVRRLHRRGIVGLFVGLAGVAALVGFDVSGGDAWSVAAVAVVAIGYALGPLILDQHLSDAPGLGVVALSQTLCALTYLPLAVTHLPGRWPNERVVGAVLVLGFVCTALAFVLFFALIAEIGPVRSTVITYVNPAVAVILGVVFLHEGFGAGTAAGFVLIICGCVLATLPAREAGTGISAGRASSPASPVVPAPPADLR